MSAKPAKIKHGTYAGYQLERKRGLPICDRCHEATRVYMAKYRTRRMPIPCCLSIVAPKPSGSAP